MVSKEGAPKPLSLKWLRLNPCFNGIWSRRAIFVNRCVSRSQRTEFNRIWLNFGLFWKIFSPVNICVAKIMLFSEKIKSLCKKSQKHSLLLLFCYFATIFYNNLTAFVCDMVFFFAMFTFWGFHAHTSFLRFFSHNHLIGVSTLWLFYTCCSPCCQRANIEMQAKMGENVRKYFVFFAFYIKFAAMFRK